jgi:hypothetical protein
MVFGRTFLLDNGNFLSAGRVCQECPHVSTARAGLDH